MHAYIQNKNRRIKGIAKRLRYDESALIVDNTIMIEALFEENKIPGFAGVFIDSFKKV